MAKVMLVLLVASLPAFVFAQGKETAAVRSGLSAQEESAIAAAKSTDWDLGPSVTIGRTRWTCSLLRLNAGAADVNAGAQLGMCTASTTGMRVHVRLPGNWRGLPPTSLLPYLERGHAAEVDSLLPHR